MWWLQTPNNYAAEWSKSPRAILCNKWVLFFASRYGWTITFASAITLAFMKQVPSAEVHISPPSNSSCTTTSLYPPAPTGPLALNPFSTRSTSHLCTWSFNSPSFSSMPNKWMKSGTRKEHRTTSSCSAAARRSWCSPAALVDLSTTAIRANVLTAAARKYTESEGLSTRTAMGHSSGLGGADNPNGLSVPHPTTLSPTLAD
mmetsp:Transcript_7140/g.15250  ORF Transcript_7140/g.15250 Transcript_7140/m.15250 type:complete len:202 (+) Transcript_7140:142-747(+)